MIRNVMFSPSFIQGEVILLLKIFMEEGLRLHTSALQPFLLVRKGGAASHSNLFLRNSMQLRTAEVPL